MIWLKKHYVLVLIVLFLIGLNVLFYYKSPHEIVAYVGIENSYLLVFTIAAIGGLSTLTGTVLYTAIATFAAGGSTPWLLGIAGGIGIFISDSIFFYLAKIGHKSLPRSWERWVCPIRNFIQKYPTWQVLIFVFAYLSFLPLPNDLLMIALVLGGYRYRTIAPIVFIGSLNIALVTAYFGTFWADLF